MRYQKVVIGLVAPKGELRDAVVTTILKRYGAQVISKYGAFQNMLRELDLPCPPDEVLARVETVLNDIGTRPLMKRAVRQALQVPRGTSIITDVADDEDAALLRQSFAGTDWIAVVWRLNTEGAPEVMADTTLEMGDPKAIDSAVQEAFRFTVEEIRWREAEGPVRTTAGQVPMGNTPLHTVVRPGD